MTKEKRDKSISTFLGPEALIEGTIHFRNTIRIDGCIKGTIKGETGTLVIGKTADIRAEIYVREAVIMGRVHGDIAAENRIEIYSPAEVTGNIRAPVISIEKGVTFNGNCGITRPSSESGAEPISGEDPIEDA
ncbi:MAG: polymer-forming cytoskeletal protein [Desulfobacterales bacterium]